MGRHGIARCVWCQKVFRRRWYHQRCCSEECMQKDRYPVEKTCVYREGITCVSRECEGCAWNPTVEAARRELLVGGTI